MYAVHQLAVLRYQLFALRDNFDCSISVDCTRRSFRMDWRSFGMPQHELVVDAIPDGGVIFRFDRADLPKNTHFLRGVWWLGTSAAKHRDWVR